MFWGSWREAAARPCTSCLWGWKDLPEPLKPMPKGSVKMPFWPYFDPILSPPEPKCFGPFGGQMCLFGPLPWRGPWGTLRDLGNLTLILTILDPFEGPGGRLRLGPRAAFGLEDLLRASNPCPGTSNFVILTTFGPSFWVQNRGPERVHGVKGRYIVTFDRRLFEVPQKVVQNVHFSIKMVQNHQKSRNLWKCASKQRV